MPDTRNLTGCTFFWKHILFVTLWGLCRIGVGHQGNFFIKNYHDDIYRAHPANWCSYLDDTGIMYFGNRSVILQFDGESWDKIIVKPNASVYDIEQGTDGYIYVGTKGDFGYLAADTSGNTKFHSLLNYVPEGCKNFKEVWKIHVIGRAVYFQSKEYLFRWRDRKIDVWKPRERFHFSYNIGRHIYIKDNHDGLLQLKGDQLIEISGFFKGNQRADHIYAMIPYEDGKVLIATGNRGLYVLNPNTSNVNQLKSSNDKLLKSCDLYGGIRLTDGNYALATLKQGMIIMDPNGQIIAIVDKSHGLGGVQITSLMQDDVGAIWLTSNEGLHRVAYEMPLTYLGPRNGLSGSIMNIIRFEGILYVATSEGVYYQDGARFKRVKGIDQHAWHFNSMPLGKSMQKKILTVATDKGVFQINTLVSKRLAPNKCTYLYNSPTYPNLLWVGDIGGISILRFERGAWNLEGKLDGIDHRIIDIEQDRKGDIWIGTDFGGLYKLDLKQTRNILTPILSRYNQNNGFKSIEEIHVYVTGADVKALAGHKFYQFNEGQNSFVPFVIPGKAAMTEGEECISINLDMSGQYWIQCKNKDYDLWIENLIPQTNNVYKSRRRPFEIVPRMMLRQVYSDLDGIVWLVGSESIIRYNPQKKYILEKNHQTIIREIGIGEMHSYKTPLLPVKNDQKPAVLPFEISYYQNNITYNFSAVSLRNPAHNLYQYKLEGLDEDWSHWNRETKAYYTNLAPGDYTFHVRSVNFDQIMSEDAIHQFKIASPWYRTYLAYVCYLILLVFGVRMILIWKTRRIELLNRKLEAKVDERTKEVHEQNSQILSQKEEIVEQNVELHKLSNEKNYLLGALAHDLKNPLSSIYSIAQLLKMENESLTDTQHQYVDQVGEISLSLTEKVTDILEVTSMEAELNKVDVQRGELTALVKSIIKTYEPLAKRKGIEITFIDDQIKYFAHYDIRFMAKAIENLLDNAIKFSPLKSVVHVSVSRPNEKIHVCINDNGPGISEEDQSRLFNRFTTLSAKPTYDEPSTGLGLSMVKNYMLAMNGKVWCESKIGNGSTFVLEI